MPEPLGPYLERVLVHVDPVANLPRDPVRFVRRYTDPRDIEIAGVFASQLAYGRVDLFGPVLERFFGIVEDFGGPRAFVDGFDGSRAEPLRPLLYRWNRGPDWIGMSAGLQRLTQAHGTLESAFAGSNGREALEAGLTSLTAAIVAAGPAFGLPGGGFDALPRGLRNWLARPANGSACKRWNLYLRWMVRPTTEGIDLGVWSTPSPASLVIPVDTHVHRVARFLGLTDRKQANWKTAEQITESLRAVDPADPLRFDFALAHLGISGACKGVRVRAICAGCPLDPVCRAPRQP